MFHVKHAFLSILYTVLSTISFPVSLSTYLTVSVLGQSLKLNIKYTNTSSIELNKKDTEMENI